MSNRQNPLKNPPKEGWTKDDRTRRCITDGCGYGRDSSGAWVGTPLSEIKISVYKKGEPNIVIARAGICILCGRVYSLTMRIYPKNNKQVAAEMGITRSGIEACMRARKKSTLFDLEELQAGQIKKSVLSPKLQELIDKSSHGTSARYTQEYRTGVYNPDVFIEPEQEVLPF